ncbi:sigma-70 family RNA polymerase sigma factor [Acutalibacter sp. 1XD8-33]|uniref:RNA polymerase sigma factor n=1 Tax=Acutalibacter sp. 1XD8-33 TaxID=2320081 RepID=UPI000EA1BC4A|nr:sigma-70 family RNA polymerase sigma factor [Acutalibacter sp. 1XD8-33]RKJ40677.1 sigma-70 family RNA polymerase sigma factor [Acutalibacter sp. 1XD8-33]
MTAEEFSGYVREYGDMVYRVALNACKNPADAEDILQTALLKLYREKSPFESPEHVRRWLIRVAVNEAKKLARSAWLRKTLPLEDYAATLEFQAPEESELFLQVMALPAKYRTPLYLYYYEGYPVREVAALCGLKESTVQTRLQRARQALKQALTQMEEES